MAAVAIMVVAAVVAAATTIITVTAGSVAIVAGAAGEVVAAAEGAMTGMRTSGEATTMDGVVGVTITQTLRHRPSTSTFQGTLLYLKKMI